MIGVKSEVIEKKEVTLERIRNLGKTKESNILHFSTHGFYLGRANNNSGEGFINNCGLALSGVNDDWDSLKMLSQNILSGDAISNLDFSNTNLVVLSACQTALGEIRGNEGVFGLQRAFKMAGADYIIASLWKVSDTETAEMMILFYKNLAQSKNIEEAFYQAQKSMRKKYDPYYWAGFVLAR